MMYISASKDHYSRLFDAEIYIISFELMYISASKDHYSRLFDTESMQVLKEYRTERPVNSASISPLRDHVS